MESFQILGIQLNAEIYRIINLTMRLAFFSTFISSLIGIPVGMLIEKKDFFLKKTLVRINRALMGFPPVVAGLIVYLILMRNGPLGDLELLFTLEAMIIAQTMIITPITIGMMYNACEKKALRIRSFAKSMGANHFQTFKLLLKEMKADIYFIIITAFGRSVSEVGAVMIAGGNIQGKTRTMTTAISLMRNRGNFEEAISLGVILIIISFSVQLVADFFRKESHEYEND